MAGMFIGEYTFKVDAKGRMSIPALFRRELEEGDASACDTNRPKLVIVYGNAKKKFLEVYTAEAFRKVAADIGNMPRGTQDRRMLERFVLGMSHPTEVDADGRLVLPQKLREKIALDKEAFFIGAGETFQIWKPETFDTENAATTDAWLDEMPDDFDPLSLLSTPSKEA
ncbi:MAG: division/cell wall cluster transcriptional repressor MraZ [Paracoccaceae bacterium]